MPSVFISYTHADQLVARRAARRLSAYGIDVWLDERELRLGSALEPTIEAHIGACDLVVPIGTAAAAQSKWVAKELSFATARNPAKSVCPLLVEPVQADPLFADHLGLDATDPHTFETKLLTLARAVLGGELPEADRGRLLTDVRSSAAEDPALAILVDACLTGPGLAATNLDIVMGLPDHTLDYAINALFDGCDDASRTQVAWHAAHIFNQRGLGSYALRKYAVLPHGESLVIDAAVGRPLTSVHHSAALNILSSCPEPNDRALASFIFHNASSLSPEDANTVVRFICHPHRKARDSTVSAAVQALTLAPTSGDLNRMWIRWIEEGQFDGTDKEAVSQRQAMRDLETILGLELADREHLTKAFRSRIRKLARTPDRKSIEIALDYLMATAVDTSPLLPTVREQLQAATGSAEWDDWPDRDEMSIYVAAFVTCASGDRNWSHAFDRYRENWQAVKNLNASLDREP